MKKMKYLLFLLMILVIPKYYVDAASVSVSSTSSSIVKGNRVTVTVTISDNEAIFFTEGNLNCSGAGVDGGINLNFDNTDRNIKSKSFSYSMNPSEVGKVTCKTNNVKYTGGSSGGWTNLGDKSITINVVKPRDKSDNNDLSNLWVDGYSLSPEFNKDILEYSVNLDSNVEKININANKEDNYANVDGTGEKEVQEGNNKFEITVTSETGKSKTYVINAIVQDSNPIEKVIDGKRYTIVKRSSALTKPEAFEETTVTIQEIEIPAFYNETTKITLVGLKDQEGSIYLYRYNQEIGTYEKFESFTSKSKTVIFENSKEEVEGYKKTTVVIEDGEYTVYQLKDNQDYVLIYGVDLETGNKGWYLYHIKEQTIQTYMSDIIDNIKEDYTKKIQEYKMVILGMSGLAAILLLMVIVEIISKNNLKKKFIKKIQKQKEALESIQEEKEKLEKEASHKNKEEKQEEQKEDTTPKKTTSKVKNEKGSTKAKS